MRRESKKGFEKQKSGEAIAESEYKQYVNFGMSFFPNLRSHYICAERSLKQKIIS